VSYPAAVGPIRAESLALSPAASSELGERPVADHASRSMVRPPVRKVAKRVAVAHRVARASRPVHHVARHVQRSVAHRVEHRVSRSLGRRAPAVGRGLSSVVAFARSQVGDSYVTGGTGGDGWDCSGLTQAAFRRAGISLPHSARAQRAMAAPVSRSAARAGDLVVGDGHVGIYMGHGMMIDAGNHRVGVSYRKMFAGLSIRRVR
jgi:cell wall-associated NlpC family hydrolase